MQTALVKKVFQDPLFFLAFGFGSGLLAKIPGTWGTIVAIPVYLLLRPLPVFLYVSVGIFICQKVSQVLGEEDYPGIVWDEIVGYLFTMTAIPLKLQWVLLGFVLFRLFDVLKPWPIAYFDRHIKGGFGIMLDDFLAAIPSWLILQFIIWKFN